MFITDTVEGYRDNPSNYECIEDFCGRHMNLGERINVCAWYNRVKDTTYFGGQWAECPPVKGKLSETACWRHGNAHSVLGKRIAAEARRKAAWEKKMDDIGKQFAKHGANYAHITLRRGKELMEIHSPIGIRGKLEALQSIGHALQDKAGRWYGCVLVRLVVDKDGAGVKYSV